MLVAVVKAYPLLQYPTDNRKKAKLSASVYFRKLTQNKASRKENTAKN
jgi:hypothetical protein